MANIEKLNKLASGQSKWIEESGERRKNKAWRKHSQKIAIKVLKTLREKGIKQKQLAEIIGVSPQQINKIVKGRENLTLETISKLENALDIQLIFVDNKPHLSSQQYKGNVKIIKEYMDLPFRINKTEVAQQKHKYKTGTTYYSKSQVNEEMVSYG